MNSEEIIRMPALMERLSLSRTTIWRLVKSGDFPPPIRLGGPKSSAAGWRSSVVDQWLQSRLRPEPNPRRGRTGRCDPTTGHRGIRFADLNACLSPGDTRHGAR